MPEMTSKMIYKLRASHRVRACMKATSHHFMPAGSVSLQKLFAAISDRAHNDIACGGAVASGKRLSCEFIVV